MRNDWLLVICPKCEQNGFLSRRWTRGSYFPQVASNGTMAFESYYRLLDAGREISPYLRQRVEAIKGRVKVFEYTGRCSIDSKNNSVYEYASTSGPGKLGQRRYVKLPSGSGTNVRKRIFQVLRRPEIRYYVGHYDSKKYHEKMKQYKEGKIKSRPNGRTWCLLNENLHFIFKHEKDMSLRKYYDFYSSLRSNYRTPMPRRVVELPTVNRVLQV